MESSTPCFPCDWNLLNCTVFSAATSHPRDWRTKTAILFPTFLRMRRSECTGLRHCLGKTDPETTWRNYEVSMWAYDGVHRPASYMAGDREHTGLWYRKAVRHWFSYTV